MELADQIIARFFTKHDREIIENKIECEYDRIVISASYNALKRIKQIIEDDSLSDPECFMRIEQIVRVFEELGSGCGSRHDFG